MANPAVVCCAGDREIALKAVSQHWEALQSVSEELRADPEILSNTNFMEPREALVLRVTLLSGRWQKLVRGLQLGHWIRGVMDFAARHFCPQLSENAFFKGGMLGQKWGAPNLQIQPPTDPMPNLKPSELGGGFRKAKWWEFANAHAFVKTTLLQTML